MVHNIVVTEEVASTVLVIKVPNESHELLEVFITLNRGGHVIVVILKLHAGNLAWNFARNFKRLKEVAKAFLRGFEITLNIRMLRSIETTNNFLRIDTALLVVVNGVPAKARKVKRGFFEVSYLL